MNLGLILPNQNQNVDEHNLMDNNQPINKPIPGLNIGGSNVVQNSARPGLAIGGIGKPKIGLGLDLSKAQKL